MYCVVVFVGDLVVVGCCCLYCMVELCGWYGGLVWVLVELVEFDVWVGCGGG